jgi:hypothetical protein
MRRRGVSSLPLWFAIFREGINPSPTKRGDIDEAICSGLVLEVLGKNQPEFIFWILGIDLTYRV